MNRSMDTRRKILVVDDDQSVCDMFARALRDRGYEVFTENHYQEGVERAGEVLPDLLFISLLLDTTNGLKASKEIHAIEKLRKAPVVMLISYKGELDPKYTMSIGIVDVLVKPLNERDIILKAENILGPDSPQNSEEIITETSDIDNFAAIPDFPDTLEQGEEYVPGSREKTDKEILELNKEYHDIPEMIDDEMKKIHETQDETADMEDISEEPLGESGFGQSADGVYAQMDNEEISLESMHEEYQDKMQDLEIQREDDFNFVHEAEKHVPRKKILMVAVTLVLIAVIGTGAYMGLQVLFAGKDRPVVMPAAQKASVKDKTDLDVGKTEFLPKTGTQPSVNEKEKKPAAIASEENKKKETVQRTPSAATVKGRDSAPGKSSVTKKAKVSGAQDNAAFSVQIGFFENLKNAETLAGKMKQKGYKVFIKNEEKVSGKMSYRVLIGKFSSRNGALALSEDILHKEGIKPILYKE